MTFFESQPLDGNGSLPLRVAFPDTAIPIVGETL